MVDPLDPVQIALMDGIDADIAWQTLRGRCFTNADGYGRRPRSAPDQALFTVGFTVTQIVVLLLPPVPAYIVLLWLPSKTSHRAAS